MRFRYILFSVNKMKMFNCHTHTMFSHDGKGSLEELCIKALENNLSGFAITDHCDCEYEDDNLMLDNLAASFAEAEKYQTLYRDRLIISKGIEIGEAIINPVFAEKIIAAKSFDVILGSVHAVRIENFDMPFSLIDFSKLSDDFIDKYLTQYFQDLLETALKSDYDILCHLTVPLRYIVYKYKRTVDIKKYFPAIEEILKTVIARNKALEVNTSGINDGYFMPDINILQMYKSYGGRRIALGSDAHNPSDISKGMTQAAEMLIKLGFTDLTYFVERKTFTYKIQPA